MLGPHELRLITKNIETEKKRCTIIDSKNDKMQMGSYFPFSVWPYSLLISDNTMSGPNMTSKFLHSDNKFPMCVQHAGASTD